MGAMLAHAFERMRTPWRRSSTARARLSPTPSEIFSIDVAIYRAGPAGLSAAVQNVVEHRAILCDDAELTVPAELLVEKNPRPASSGALDAALEQSEFQTNTTPDSIGWIL
jgi:hypothetical protein